MGSLSSLARGLFTVGAILGASSFVVLLWNHWVGGSFEATVADVEIVLLVSAAFGGFLISVPKGSTFRSAVIPILVLAPVAPLAAWLGSISRLPETISSAPFLLLHFGLPALVVSTLTCALWCRTLSLRGIGGLVSLVFLGEILGQLIVNPLMFLLISQRIGLAAASGHGAGVHHLWQPQFVTVTVGALVGAYAFIHLAQRAEKSVNSIVPWVPLAVGSLLTLGYLAVAINGHCERCLDRIPEYVLAACLLVASLVAVIVRERKGWNGAST